MPAATHTTNTKGFTLVELMVVISIIAVLSTIGLVIYRGAQAKARDSLQKTDLNNLATALELYNQTKGNYVLGTSYNDTSLLYNNKSIKSLMNGSIPTDPKGNQYYYTSTFVGSTYTLCANLENLSDPDCGNTAGSSCPAGPASTCKYGLQPK